MNQNENQVAEDPAEKVVIAVQHTPTQRKFYNSERCETAREALQELIDSTGHTTDSAYYNGGLGFMDRHLHYLSTHPQVNMDGYLSNLRLMTKVR